MHEVELFDWKIVTDSEQDFWEALKGFLERPETEQARLLMTPNPEQVVRANKDVAFKEAVQQADWLIPDGIGLVKASQKFFKHKLRKSFCHERIAGADIVIRLIKWSQEKTELSVKRRILVLGGFYQERVLSEVDKESGVAQIELQDGSRVWWEVGFSKIKNPTIVEKSKLIEIIMNFKPTVVLVAFGAPEQEKWLVQNKTLLDSAGVKLGMAIGGSLDFLTGKVSRAPSWMRRLGGEWFYRLLRQPWRWRRQLALLEFYKLVAAEIKRELMASKNNKDDK